MSSIKEKSDSDYLISMVIPLLNEQEVLDELYCRLKEVCGKLRYKTEIVFVNDGSTDLTETLLSQIATRDKMAKVVNLSRNFGHQEALLAGLHFCKGDAVVVLDGDLQDPPEVIEEMIDLWIGGHEVVYAVRKNRKEAFWRRFLYSVFYRILASVSRLDIPLDSGDFSLMDRKVVDAIKACPEVDRFQRGIRAWVGFKQIGLEYDRAERAGGRTKYSMRKLLKLALDGVISNSSVPIKFSTFLGLSTTIGAFIGILVFLYLRLFTDITIPGQSSIIISIFFFSGVQLLMTGILGEYVHRTYLNARGRPVYVVKNCRNIELP